MKALEILKAKQQVLNSNLKDRINKSHNLQYEDDNQITNTIISELNFIDEAIKELEDLPYKDRLAELEKAILDYYLSIGYKVGEGGWTFMINISTLYKFKEIQIKFCKDIISDFEIVFRTHSETTEEILDKAFKHFSAKGDNK